MVILGKFTRDGNTLDIRVISLMRPKQSVIGLSLDGCPSDNPNKQGFNSTYLWARPSLRWRVYEEVETLMHYFRVEIM